MQTVREGLVVDGYIKVPSLSGTDMIMSIDATGTLTNSALPISSVATTSQVDSLSGSVATLSSSVASLSGAFSQISSTVENISTTYEFTNSNVIASITTAQITLKLFSSPINGDFYKIHNDISKGYSIIDGNGKLISGKSTFKIYANESIELRYNGLNWIAF
jgi:hypothetical protein